MRPRNSGGYKGNNAKDFRREGPNWILIAGGALLSTLSIRFGYKLKQALEARQPPSSQNGLEGSEESTGRTKLRSRHLHTNVYSFAQDEDGCFNYIPGAEGIPEIRQPPNSQVLMEPNMSLPLVTVPPPDFEKENGVVWASSPDRLELPPRPFHHSNCSDSPCVSESGSDIFSKREVIHKLRQQLKRRDDMILEMQDQILELQNSLSAQLSHSNHLQSQLDTANKDLLDCEREIQRLRKAIADHCVEHLNTNEKPSTATDWPPEGRNGRVNGHVDCESNSESSEKGRGDLEGIDMLRLQVRELKEIIQGKEYLLQSYKEQKAELSDKIKELQQRLDSQLPNIL
ncbi:hypothetical protein RJ641_015651 [Dillenia turbinata]|uniref:Uncharacterized protein n=1 Tax=Dillenia turbinata TaxID=194707 RepID=A0AAN8UZD8_9MAGN